MLYQTHLPIFFQFNTFNSITIPLSATATISTPLLPSSSSSSVVQEMECVEAALKTNLRKEMALKPNPHGGFDDVCAVNLQNVDDFFVDDLLDFSNEDGEPQEAQQKDEPNEEQSLSISSPKQEQEQHEEEDNSLDESFNFDDLGPIPASELAVPADDVANLEWLSHFVEDSFTEFSAPFPAGALPEKPKDDVSEPKAPSLASPCFKTPVPAKARSKRTRTGVRIWSLGSPALSDSSSNSTISYSSSPSSPRLHYNNSGSTGSFGPAEQFSGEKLPKKKPKKKPQTEGLNGRVSGGGSLFVRRCSHCGVQKTPQWRTGPLGAKTLCNACGVRYKSGRLFPEYRPACSPTFSSELHSNHHRKVLEMRRKKELLGQAEPGLTPPVVPSF